MKSGPKSLWKSLSLGMLAVVLAVSVVAVTQMGSTDIRGRAAGTACDAVYPCTYPETCVNGICVAPIPTPTPSCITQGQGVWDPPGCCPGLVPVQLYPLVQAICLPGVAGLSCTTTRGWPGTCTTSSGCKIVDQNISWDTSVVPCSAVSGYGCCGDQMALLGISCKTSAGWPGTCTLWSICDVSKPGIAWDTSVIACGGSGGVVGCCGKLPIPTPTPNYQCFHDTVGLACSTYCKKYYSLSPGTGQCAGSYTKNTCAGTNKGCNLGNKLYCKCY
jgi:hypothetical protein